MEYNLTRMNHTSTTESGANLAQKQTPFSLDPPSHIFLGKWGSAIRRVFSFPALLGALLVTTVFAMSRNGLSDPDIWWHLRNAEYLLVDHKFVRFDMYSFTLAGHPWVNPEWLGEIPFYLAWQAWGL